MLLGKYVNFTLKVIGDLAYGYIRLVLMIVCNIDNDQYNMGSVWQNVTEFRLINCVE